MAKKYAQYAAIAGSLVPIAKTPLDNRLIVEFVSDLTNSKTWQADNNIANWYVGMIVSVLEDSKTYKLVGNDPTIFSNWEQLSGQSDFHISTINLNGVEVLVLNNDEEDSEYGDPFEWGNYAYGSMED